MNYNYLKEIYLKSPLVFKKIYSFIPFHIRMGKKYREMLTFLERTQYWSKTNWEEYQKTKIFELLNYCYDNVPYYKNLFDRNRIRIESKRNILKEFSKIPFMNKKTVRENFNFLISNEFNENDLYQTSTGGTTGKPLKYLWSKDCFKMSWAFKIFFWNLAIDYNPRMRKATFRGVKMGDRLYYKNPIYNEIRISPFKINEKYIHKIDEVMKSFFPKYFHGYPSAILALSKLYEKLEIETPKLKGIILISENIYEEQREFIERIFNTKTYSFYGHTEKLIFASMDQTLDYYLVHPAYGFTELIDKKGKIIKRKREFGELVGTGFINKAMPLIRYKTGDYAQWDVNNNIRNFQVISSIQGRWEQEFIVGSDGTKISLAALNMHSQVFENIKNFQIHQKVKGELILNIVKDDNFNEKDEKEILGQLREKLEDNFKIKFKYLDELEKTIRGKAKYIIQEIEL